MILKNFLINGNKFLKISKKSAYVLKRLDNFEDLLKFFGNYWKKVLIVYGIVRKWFLIFSPFPEKHSKIFLIEQKNILIFSDIVAKRF